MTPDQFKKVGVGVIPSPSPFLTPRPERFRMDPRALEPKLSNRHEKEREVNVQVILRCRPLSDDEQRSSASKVITCNEQKREVTVSQNLASKQVDRVFTFDKVFGPRAQQRSIYDHTIAPIVNEVVDGYNCTVFAYGQTGTGKTYTMEGGMRSKGGELCAEAGVIPRAVRQIFEILEAQNADYSMKVTFLELYNEEITDLLSLDENSRFVEDKHKKSVSLMEDGKGCVVIRGLEEEVVYSANDIYNLLERGAAKRRTADTLLNKRSSRSHSVFTITVHVKETTVGDEELIKCGKLNLVDLAGSENITRSGLREGRAREAGEINKSLLTLGRVINALVEHSAHIPYRDSKLTRLLRDSLGGKTKTCIIATISPTAHCLDETLSTLDYAYRAKNIKNKPEANQKMSKTVLLKELYMEIERMKQDVRAARERNGVYIPQERFVQDEVEKKARNEKIEQLEMELEQSRKDVDKYHQRYLSEQEKKLDLQVELTDCKKNLDSTNKAMQELQDNHKLAILQLMEKDFIISKLLNSENSLIECAKEMRSTLQNASEDIMVLHTNIDEKNKLEAQNHKLVLTFGSQLDQSLKELHKTILGSVSQQQDQLRRIDEHLSSFLASKNHATKNLESMIQKIAVTHSSAITTLRDSANALQRKATADLEGLYSTMSSQTINIEQLLESLVIEAKDVIHEIQNSHSMQTGLLAFSAQQQEQGLQRTLVSTDMIAKATVGFFDEICGHASELIANLEETQTRNYNHLRKFEKMFKEQSAKQEQQAIEKIVSALAVLTTNNKSLVSDTLRNIHETETQDKMLWRQHLSNIQQVSTTAKMAMSGHMEIVEEHCLRDSYLQTQMRATMEEHIQECSQREDYSREQWKRAQESINNINNNGRSQIQSTINKKICKNEIAKEQHMTMFLAKDVEFDGSISCLLMNIKDSLMLDSETKNIMDSFSNQCLDQLTSMQNKHNRSLSTTWNKLEQCLTKDYKIDHHPVPEKKVLAVPSLVSIDGMRTPAIEDLLSSKRLEGRSNNSSQKNTKIQQQFQDSATWPIRAPFADVN